MEAKKGARGGRSSADGSRSLGGGGGGAGLATRERRRSSVGGGKGGRISRAAAAATTLFKTGTKLRAAPEDDELATAENGELEEATHCE